MVIDMELFIILLAISLFILDYKISAKNKWREIKYKYNPRIRKLK